MNNGATRTGSLIEIHAAVAFFGLAGLFGKWLALSPLLIVLGRVVFASLALGLLLAAKRISVRVEPRGDRALFLVQGLLLAAHWAAFFQAVQVSTVAVGLLSYSSFPLFTAFLEPTFLRRRLEPRNIFLAGVCLAGVFLIVPRFTWTDSTFRGVLWGVFSGLTFSVLSIINRMLTARHPSVLIAFGQDLVAALALLPFAFLLRPAWTGRDIALLAVLGIVCTAGAHTLFIQGLRRISAQAASIVSSLEPVYGIVLAFIFLKEVPVPRTIVGGAVILGAVIVISLKSPVHKRVTLPF